MSKRIKTITSPLLASATVMSAPQLNNVHFAGDRSVLTPDKIVMDSAQSGGK